MNGKKVTWVIRLPRIDPPFSDGEYYPCMRARLTWPGRILRQVFPRKSTRECCWAHGLDWHAISAAAVSIAQARPDLLSRDDDEAGEELYELLRAAGLPKEERLHATFLLSPGCGVNLYRMQGEWRWQYYDGRHRAQGMMSAGVRRTVIDYSDDED